MPPKRRQRHGVPASPPTITLLKTSVSDNSIADHHPTNKLITPNGFGGGHGDHEGNNGGIDEHALTVKERQQLERNTYLLGLSKDQLKAECKRRGQKTTGTKTELVQLTNKKKSIFFFIQKKTYSILLLFYFKTFLVLLIIILFFCQYFLFF